VHQRLHAMVSVEEVRQRLPALRQGCNFLYRARSSSQKQKDHFDKYIHLPQPATETPFPRVENRTLPHKVDSTWRSSDEASWGHFNQPFSRNSLAWLPLKTVSTRLTELPQPLHQHAAAARAQGCDAQVAEPAACVGAARSDFTQPANHPLLLRDRPNFLLLTVEQGI